MAGGSEILKALHDVKGHADTLEKFRKAVERATAGKDPFPPPKKLDGVFKSLGDLSRHLDGLARSGLGRPQEELASLDELADPKSRDAAKIKIFNNMVTLESALKDGEQLSSQVEATRTTMESLHRLYGDLLPILEKLVKYPVGSLGKELQAQAFEYHRLFEQAQGEVSGVVASAKKAQAKIAPELADLGKDIDNLQVTVRTFLGDEVGSGAATPPWEPMPQSVLPAADDGLTRPAGGSASDPPPWEPMPQSVLPAADDGLTQPSATQPTSQPSSATPAAGGSASQGPAPWEPLPQSKTPANDGLTQPSAIPPTSSSPGDPAPRERLPQSSDVDDPREDDPPPGSR